MNGKDDSELRVGKNRLPERHGKDTVSDEEQRRNDVICSRQGNRTPFIDRPERVDAVSGDKC